MLTVTQAAVDEMKELVKEGDIDLALRRKTFARIYGRETTLDDDKLTIACLTEDDDDEEFVINCLDIELGQYEVSEDSIQAPRDQFTHHNGE